MKTYSAKPSDVERKWYVVDADGLTLGRMSTRIATILRGKHKPIYTPHVDTGDYVIVINAEKVYTTGNRMDNKMYHHHSRYPGGLKSLTLREMLQRNPEKVTRDAVRRMLPKGALGRQMLKKLKIYPGPEHPHKAQNPETLNLKE